MKRNLLIVGIVIVVLAGGIFFARSRQSSSQTPATTSQTSTQQQSASSSPAPETSNSGALTQGQYIEYSDTNLATTQGTKILFFHAPWCPQCRQLEEDILSSGLPQGVTVLKVDYDSNQALRKKYGVTIQTTLVKVDDQGNLVKKYVAYDSPTVTSLEENLL